MHMQTVNLQMIRSHGAYARMTGTLVYYLTISGGSDFHSPGFVMFVRNLTHLNGLRCSMSLLRQLIEIRTFIT